MRCTADAETTDGIYETVPHPYVSLADEIRRNWKEISFVSVLRQVRNNLSYSKILSKFLQVQMIKDSFIEYYNWQSIPCMIENYTCNENKIKTASLPRTMNKLYSWNKSLSISSHLLSHPNEFNFLKSITDLYSLSLPITTTIKKTHTLPN